MNKINKLPEIRKESFLKARESLGLTTQELAGKACLSARQIEQIENGESASFYGAQNKYTAAKKVAAILNLGEVEAFDFTGIPSTVATPAEAPTTKKVEKVIKPETKKETKQETQQEVKPAAKAVPEPKLQPQQELKLDAAEKKSVPQQKQPIESPAADLAIELGDPVGRVSGGNRGNPSSSQRKWFLLLGMVAAIVFAVINLRPMFFAEKPAEEVAVNQEAPADSAPVNAPASAEERSAIAAVTPTTASPATVAGDCPTTDSAPVAYRPEAPKKVGDMVYLQAKTAQVVCVIDAQGKVQTKQLEPGVGMSVYGKPPLKVLTSGLDQVELFYQGAKVRPSNPNAKTIILESAEFNQPLAPSDSQLR